MATPATATILATNNITNTITFETVTLVDNDLIRGDDAGEVALRNTTTFNTIFDGFQTFRATGPGLHDGSFVTVAGDISANLTFSDGTTLSGVRGLLDAIPLGGGTGGAAQFFVFDTAALAAVGKSITDVARINSFTLTDHDLNWSDFGFSGMPVTPVPPPPPPPPPPAPVLNRIEGTSGRDVLRGTDGDDLIIANGGNRDRLTGGEGNDTFVFGAQAGNGVRDIAVITDYDAFEDTLLLTNGAQVSRFIEGRDSVTIILAGGDGDRIILQNVPDSGPLFKIEFDPDFIV